MQHLHLRLWLLPRREPELASSTGTGNLLTWANLFFISVNDSFPSFILSNYLPGAFQTKTKYLILVHALLGLKPKSRMAMQLSEGDAIVEGSLIVGGPPRLAGSLLVGRNFAATEK